MKTLYNQTLLYDEDCPLCRAYTTGFIQAGMLGTNGKKPFVALSASERKFIDLKRAANEIALVDNENKTVLYGIDSLLKVIGNSFPWMAKTGHWKPVNFLLRKLYAFISYNRKVIIPSAKKPENELVCVPDFNFRYRLLFIAFAGLMTSLVLWKFAGLLPQLPKGNFMRELILAFGQLIFQGGFLIGKDKKTILNYFGNLMTVSFMGALILLPVLFISTFATIPEIIILGWFGLTVCIMFAEHYRRIKLLGLPHFLCYTWILYRIIALLLIVNL